MNENEREMILRTICKVPMEQLEELKSLAIWEGLSEELREFIDTAIELKEEK